MSAKTVDDYLKLPYTIEVFRDANEDDPGWVARVAELPGCLTQADTFEELGEMIEDAMRGWIEIALEDGTPVPEPRPDEAYSGKFVVRVPKSLHRRLVETAEAEGVSLNQYINVALAGAISGDTAPVSGDPQQEAAEHTGWPGLSGAAKDTLRKSGLQDEAGKLDERLFADWISRMVGQVESACADSDFSEASRYILQTISTLNKNAERSPVLESLVYMLQCQHNLVEQSRQMQQGIVNQALNLQINQRMSKTFPLPSEKMQPSSLKRPKDLPFELRDAPESLDVTPEFLKFRDLDRDE